MNQKRIHLDRSKLFGFKLVATSSKSGTPSDPKLGAKLGAKIGGKAGNKVGLK